MVSLLNQVCGKRKQKEEQNDVKLHCLAEEEMNLGS